MAEMEIETTIDFKVSRIPIKFCPFCSGEAKLAKVSEGHCGNNHAHDSFRIVCTGCGMVTPTFYSDIYQDDNGDLVIKSNGAIEAIKMWNRREI